MASKQTLARNSMQLQPMKGDRLMFSSGSDDDALMKQIQETHISDGLEIDVKPLLRIVEDIFNSSTTSIDGISSTATRSHAEASEDKTHQNNLVGILEALAYVIDRIAAEIAWKCSGGGDANATSMSILGELSNYSWDAKLVIALAAFAMNYGEFWLIAQSYSTNQLAKSVAILRQLPEIFERSSMLKPRFDAVRNLIKAMLDISRCIVELKELPSQYITTQVTAFFTAVSLVPIAVYWTIRSIVACAAQITGLVGMGHEYEGATTESWELSSLAYKLSNIHSRLMSQLTVCYKHIDEKKFIESYQNLLHLFEMPVNDNMRVLKALLCAKDDQQPLVEGATKRRVNIEVLRRKLVLILVSDLDVLQEEHAVLEQIYNESRQNQNEGYYEVVWFPISNTGSSWTESRKKRFENLQALMPWYSMYNPPLIDRAAIKFFQEVCHFEKKHNVLVAIDQHGRLASPNALPMMWIWRSRAYPFTTIREEALWKEESWRLELLVDGIDPIILNWISEGRYICLYGGEDIDWIRKFTGTANAVAKAAGISLGMVYVGKSNPKDRIRTNIITVLAEKLSHCWQEVTSIWYFWVRIQSMWHSRNQLERTIDNDPILPEILTLLSYDGGEGGWAILGGGSDADMAKAKGNAFLTCLSDYSNWKEHVEQKGFVEAVKDYLKELQTPHHCNRLKLPTIAAKMPESVVCPECGRTMDRLTLYQCCDE